jgi:hypothetical protein
MTSAVHAPRRELRRADAENSGQFPDFRSVETPLPPGVVAFGGAHCRGVRPTHQLAELRLVQPRRLAEGADVHPDDGTLFGGICRLRRRSSCARLLGEYRIDRFPAVFGVPPPAVRQRVNDPQSPAPAVWRFAHHGACQRRVRHDHGHGFGVVYPQEGHPDYSRAVAADVLYRVGNQLGRDDFRIVRETVQMMEAECRADVESCDRHRLRDARQDECDQLRIDCYRCLYHGSVPSVLPWSEPARSERRPVDKRCHMANHKYVWQAICPADARIPHARVSRRQPGRGKFRYGVSLYGGDERAPGPGGNHERGAVSRGGVADQDQPTGRGDFYALPAVGA